MLPSTSVTSLFLERFVKMCGKLMINCYSSIECLPKVFVSVLLILSSFIWQYHEASCALEYQHVITIDQKGNDSDSCLIGRTACKTLVYSFINKRPNTKYVLTEGVHNVDSSDVMFSGLTTLAFIGNNSTVQCTKRESGLAFFNVTNITFSDITFSNCSATRNSTSRDYNSNSSIAYFQVALYFYQCSSVTMQYVGVINSPSATGVVMYDTSGYNRFSDSTFSNNQLNPPVKDSPSPFGGGGGFYVEFTYCNLTNAPCNRSDNHPEKAITSTVYSFERCQFAGNIANDSGNSTYIVPHHNDHNAFGRGGGLSIFVKGNSSYNNFTIVDCLFSNNRALWGAGLFVEFHDTAFNNSINVSNSNFVKNVCPYTASSGTAGAGMRIGHYIYGDTEEHTGYGNQIYVEKCQFANNRALNGGGLSVSITPQDNTTNANQLSQITITDCEFMENTARLGSAIHVDRFQLILIGQVLTLAIRNCTFSSNSINFMPDNYTGAYQVGVGTVFVHNVPMHFMDSANFTNNTGSGLAIVVGEANFCGCKASFVGNSGNNGGGIALLGEAYIKVNEETIMIFTNNSATLHGGGIYNKYISRENLDSYTQCFVRHGNPFKLPDAWGATFNFSGNTDLGDHRNSAIYTTSILPCSWAGGSGVNKNKSAIFCWNGWFYKNVNGERIPCKEEINTDVGEIIKEADFISAYPGHPFDLKLNITDDLGNEKTDKKDIETVFIASISRNNSYRRNSFFHAWENGAILKEKGNVTLVLDTVEDRVWQISVKVELKSCPPGFISTRSSNDTNSVTCTCNTAKNYGGALFCDYNNFTALLRNGYWIGNIELSNTSELDHNLVSLCPVGFCYISDNSSFFRLNKTLEEVDRQICGTNNRTGILCGLCIEGFGPAINSRTFDCVNCSDVSTKTYNILKYIATVYIPNFVLFVLIIAFKIQLTSGAANSFILYCQLVSSTFNLDADGQISLNFLKNKKTGILSAYRLIYGIFNLEFFENLLSPLCVSKDINTLTVISTDYAVAAAPLVMILVIIIITNVTDVVGNCCAKRYAESRRIVNGVLILTNDVKRYINKGLLSAFAAFLLLSYTKFSLTSSYILRWEPLVDKCGATVQHSDRVYYAGNYTSNDYEYITHYLIPACFILAVFVIIPPILLLDYPIRMFEKCLMRFDKLWVYYPAGKVHVLLDTFQGCFKHNFRFFAGLYFLFRLTISVNFIVSKTLLQQYTVQQITCIIMIILVAMCQPYDKKNKLFNYIDVLIFSNLAVVNALTLYLYEYIQTNPTMKPPVSAFAIQYVLVYLPLIYILIYMLWYICKHTPCKQFYDKFFASKLTTFNKWKRYTPLDGRASCGNLLNVTHTEVSGGIEESLTDEAIILRRAEMTNTYQPAKVNNMLTIDEDQSLDDAGNTASSRSSDENVRPLRSDQPSTNSAKCNYGSIKNSRLQHSSSSGRSSNSSQFPLGSEAERGLTWPMQ